MTDVSPGDAGIFAIAAARNGLHGHVVRLADREFQHLGPVPMASRIQRLLYSCGGSLSLASALPT